MLRPLLDPSHGVAYVKAFYSRLSLETQALQGRATRLFVGPLLASLEQIFGPLPYLRYLQGFRYPLAGEFAFTTDLAMNLRISPTGDWRWACYQRCIDTSLSRIARWTWGCSTTSTRVSAASRARGCSGWPAKPARCCEG